MKETRWGCPGKSAPGAKFVVSRYKLSTGTKPYTDKFWIRMFFLLGLLTTVMFLNMGRTLVSQNRYASKANRFHVSKRTPFANLPVIPVDHAFSAGGPGTSLVTACQNEHESLRYSLSTWIEQDGLKEIVIIDWGSKPPLRLLVEEIDITVADHPPIHVVHVKKPAKWIPSQAFNFGVRAARFSRILQVGCGNKLRRDFLKHHELPVKSFVVGGEHLARDDDDLELNRVLLIPRNAFIEIGGYDERIQQYGGEHEDLVRRLSEKGMKRLDLDYAKIHTKSNQDSAVRFVNYHLNYIEQEVNLELLRILPAWDARFGNGSTIIEESHLEEQCITTKSFRHPLVSYSTTNTTVAVKSIRTLLDASALSSARERVLRRNLEKKFNIADCISSNLCVNSMSKLYWFLSTRTSPLHVRRFLIIHCIGSLPSRINLLLSGLSISRKLGRQLIVFWDRKKGEKKTSFLKVFYHPQEALVLDSRNAVWSGPSVNCKREHISFHTALKKRNQRGLIFKSFSKTVIYIRTDIPLRVENIKLLNKKLMTAEFKKLKLNQDIVHSLEDLKDRGLRSSAGFYFGNHSPQTKRANIENLAAFTAFQTKSRKLQSQQGGQAIKFYLDAVKPLIERIAGEKVSIIDNAALLLRRNDMSDFSNIFTRVLALTETQTFSSYIDNEFTEIVEIIRFGN